MDRSCSTAFQAVVGAVTIVKRWIRYLFGIKTPKEERRMKRSWFLVTVLIAFAGTLAFAGGTRGASAMSEDPLCGSWYGGSYNPDNAGYKYQYTFIPTGKGRWYVMADGAYNPDSLGAAVATTWTGEVIERDGKYEIRLLALTTNDPTEPPEEVPTVHGVQGFITLDSDGEATINYNSWGAYNWGDSPFVSEPATWMLPPGSSPITETIQRVSTQAAAP